MMKGLWWNLLEAHGKASHEFQGPVRRPGINDHHLRLCDLSLGTNSREAASELGTTVLCQNQDGNLNHTKCNVPSRRYAKLLYACYGYARLYTLRYSLRVTLPCISTGARKPVEHVSAHPADSSTPNSAPEGASRPNEASCTYQKIMTFASSLASG